MDNEDFTTNVFQTFRKSSIATTALQILPTSTVQPKNGVTLKAGPANTFVLFVGPSTVTADSADTTDGYPLSAGEEMFIATRDPSLLWVVGASGASAQKLFGKIE